MADAPVLLDVEDGVATVTLNRPDRRNALSAELADALAAALDEAGAGDARCLVLTGAGGAFSAGGDVARMRRRLEEDWPVDEAVRDIERRTADLVGRVYRFPLPTVAAVDGPAVGAGAGLALACDLQVASERATLGFVFRGVGLTCDAGTSYLLPRYVGPNVAKELVLTGDLVDAERALDLGLVNRVVPTDGFDDRVAELAGDIADGPTVALRHAVRLLDADASSLEAAMREEAAAQGVALGTDDHAEGVAAFVEGRDPAFEGR